MILSCPACTHLLAEKCYGTVTAQVCTIGCGGIWLSPQDIQAMTKTPRIVDRVLAATGSVTPLKHNDQRQCPSCRKDLETWNVKGAGSEVEIDICPRCQGIWLDQGEVATLVILNRRGRPEQHRKALPVRQVGSALTVIGVAGDVLDAAAVDPFLAADLIDVSVNTAAAAIDIAASATDAAYLAVDVATVAADALPAVIDAAGAAADTVAAVAEAVASAADAAELAVVATEVAGATLEAAGAVAEIAGGAAEAIGGLFDLFSIFG